MDTASTSREDEENQGFDASNDDAEPEVGYTRDKVAKAVGIKTGRTFDRMKAVVKKADELKEQGKSDDAALFFTVLNRSASAAYELMEVALESLTDHDRQNIRTGKVAPRMIFSKQSREKSKRKTAYDKILTEIHLMGDSVQLVKKSITRLKDTDEQGEVRDLLVDMIQDLRMLPVSDDYDKFIQIHDEYSSVVASLAESISTFLNDYGLNECKKFIEEDIESLKKLLSVVESELEKKKDNE